MSYFDHGSHVSSHQHLLRDIFYQDFIAAETIVKLEVPKCMFGGY